MSLRHHLKTLGLSAMLLSSPMVLAAGENLFGENIILGAEGELLQVLQGTYGDLFPQGTEVPPHHQVLALQIDRHGEDSERLLVPGTEGPEFESAPSATHDRASESLFIVWEATRTIHSELYIIQRSEDGWSELLEFSGNPFTLKSSPRLVATHERHIVFENEIPETVQRTVLHLTWWDESNGEGRVLYAPLLLEPEGLIITDALDLRDFLPDSLPVEEAIDNEVLAHSPYIEPGADANEILLAFVDPASQRLVTVASRLNGIGIDALADEARAQVIIIGLHAGGLDQLANELHTSLAESSHVDPLLADYLAQSAADALRDLPAGTAIQNAADEARAQVIIIGARVREGITNVTGDARAQVIIIGSHHPGLPFGRSIALEVLNDRAVPAQLPADVTPALLLAPDGHSMIVAWTEEDSVHYVESDGDGWGEERSIELDDHVDAQRVYHILQQRLAH